MVGGGGPSPPTIDVRVTTWCPKLPLAGSVAPNPLPLNPWHGAYPLTCSLAQSVAGAKRPIADISSSIVDSNPGDAQHPLMVEMVTLMKEDRAKEQKELEDMRNLLNETLTEAKKLASAPPAAAAPAPDPAMGQTVLTIGPDSDKPATMADMLLQAKVS